MNLYFAPIQGYTDYAFRRIHYQLAGGVEDYFTPFVRWEKGLRNKDRRDVGKENCEGVPTVPQIIARDETEFNALCDALQAMGWNHIDLNLGCPFPLQTGAGRGSGLLPHPDRIAALLKEMELRGDCHFSVKMRLGLSDNEEWQRVLPMLNDSCISRITLHPRIGRQQYKGGVDKEQFSRFYSLCKKPLVWNGDVASRDDILRLEKDYPLLEGIMIGRGLLALPSLAKEYKEQRDWEEKERIHLLRQLHEQLFLHTRQHLEGDHQILARMHSFWEYQKERMPHKEMKKVMKAGSVSNYCGAVGELFRAI